MKILTIFYFYKSLKASNQDYFKTTDLYGATYPIRTDDPRITSAMLWPTELKWHLFNLCVW